MRRLLGIMIAGLLIAASGVPAAAWEFSMKGEFEHRVRYIGRTGNTDLFGVAPLQEGATPLGGIAGQAVSVGFAGPNWYNRNRGPSTDTLPLRYITGAEVDETPAAGTNTIVTRAISPVTGRYVDTGGGRIVRGGFSTWGSDALYNDSRLTLRPVIRVNPAIRVHGVYTIGGMRHKYFQNYIGGFGMGIGTPPLERYYAHHSSMNAYDTAALGSWEQFRVTIELPIGILSYGIKDFPFGTGATLANNTRTEAFLLIAPYGPFLLMHAIWWSDGPLAPQRSWFIRPDKESKNSFFQTLVATYACGAFDAGAISILQTAHLNAAEMNGPAADWDLWFNQVFAKYNNGRVFAAAEYAWAVADLHHIGAAPVGIEVYHFFAEAGAVAGPAKVRFLYALASGPVLNSGNPTKAYWGFPINYQAMAPYQYLMFEVYGGGNNGGWAGTDVTFVSEDHGMMSDAYCFGARADYAVASNLNIWASYLWAHRLERAGFYAGGIAADGGVGNTAVAAAQAFKALNGFGANANPYVDDGHIGWEADAGIDWKLLEGLKMLVRYAYWQPGKWFDQAYQAIGMVGGVPTTGAIVTGRDAIHAINGSLVIDF